MKNSILLLFALIVGIFLSGCVDTQPTAKMDINDTTVTLANITPIEILTTNTQSNNSNESIVTQSLPTQCLQNTNNISFSWEFGCIKFCKEDSESTTETNSMLLITNTGETSIPKMKLYMQFYKLSGTLANERSSGVYGFYDVNNNLIDAVPARTISKMYINVPNFYLNEEVWSYAEVYLIYNNSRNHLATWKSEYIKVKDGEQKVLPVINGTFEMIT